MGMGTSLFEGRELHIQACETAYQFQTRSNISSRGRERSSPYENFDCVKAQKDFGLRHNDNGLDRPTTANSQCAYDSCEAMRTMAQKSYLRNWDRGHLLNN